MDFEDTPEEAAYRLKARKWLEENAPKNIADSSDDEIFDLQACKAWQAKKSDAGYAKITWPKEWGGGAGTTIQSVIFSQEEARAGVSSLNRPFAISLGISLPSVLANVNEETQLRFAKPGARGEEIWCQLFSEPSGGSDVAGIRTRAVKDGDDWIINGQKIWTSGAHYCDYGIIITRTNPDVPKHAGLTMFWVSMKTPGIEIRPIHQMSGASGFNEVFFTDVRVNDSQRVSEVNDGWAASIRTLMVERASVGGGDTPGGSSMNVYKLAHELGMLDDRALREKLADWYATSEGLRFTGMRMLTALSRGQIPGPEGSITKIVLANLEQDMTLQALELQDQFGLINDSRISPLTALFQQSVLGAPGMRIAGGTDEILRNVIAERVLGLPGDVRVDKTLPFNQLPKGV
ncbi:MAG: acyl-CoA dehydrogenase family protein [Caulobacterales bacterium]